MNPTEEIKAKLNKRFPNTPLASLANNEEWAAAADVAGSYCIWGIWETLRKLAGLPSDEAARQNVISKMKKPAA